MLFFWQKFPDMHLHISPSLVAGLVAALDHPFWNARFSSDFSRPRIWNRRRTHSDQWPDCHVWWVPFPSHGGKPPSETSFGFGYERWEMRSYTYSIRMISGEILWIEKMLKMSSWKCEGMIGKYRKGHQFSSLRWVYIEVSKSQSLWLPGWWWVSNDSNVSLSLFSNEESKELPTLFSMIPSMKGRIPETPKGWCFSPSVSKKKSFGGGCHPKLCGLPFHHTINGTHLR